MFQCGDKGKDTEKKESARIQYIGFARHIVNKKEILWEENDGIYRKLTTGKKNTDICCLTISTVSNTCLYYVCIMFI